jgi:hypothetical protein
VAGFGSVSVSGSGSGEGFGSGPGPGFGSVSGSGSRPVFGSGSCAGTARGNELRDTQEARLSAIAQWIQPRIESGELAPLPLPLIESLALGPVVGVARRWLSGIDDVDLDEAARLLPDRIWRSLAA